MASVQEEPYEEPYEEPVQPMRVATILPPSVLMPPPRRVPMVFPGAAVSICLRPRLEKAHAIAQ